MLVLKVVKGSSALSDAANERASTQQVDTAEPGMLPCSAGSEFIEACACGSPLAAALRALRGVACVDGVALAA